MVEKYIPNEHEINRMREYLRNWKSLDTPTIRRMRERCAFDQYSNEILALELEYTAAFYEHNDVSSAITGMAFMMREAARRIKGMKEDLEHLASICPCPHSGETECHFSEPCEVCSALGRGGFSDEEE